MVCFSAEMFGKLALVLQINLANTILKNPEGLFWPFRKLSLKSIMAFSDRRLSASDAGTNVLSKPERLVTSPYAYSSAQLVYAKLMHDKVTGRQVWIKTCHSGQLHEC